MRVNDADHGIVASAGGRRASISARASRRAKPCASSPTCGSGVRSRQSARPACRLAAGARPPWRALAFDKRRRPTRRPPAAPARARSLVSTQGYEELMPRSHAAATPARRGAGDQGISRPPDPRDPQGSSRRDGPANRRPRMGGPACEGHRARDRGLGRDRHSTAPTGSTCSICARRAYVAQGDLDRAAERCRRNARRSRRPPRPPHRWRRR